MIINFGIKSLQRHISNCFNRKIVIQTIKYRGSSVLVSYHALSGTPPPPKSTRVSELLTVSYTQPSIDR